MAGFALTFVALPFGESLIVADLNVGIFYMIAVTALVVVGILLAGWSSNSKWALFGGMRVRRPGRSATRSRPASRSWSRC